MRLPSEQELNQIADGTIFRCTVPLEKSGKTMEQYMANRLTQAIEAIKKNMPSVIDEFWDVCDFKDEPVLEGSHVYPSEQEGWNGL